MIATLSKQLGYPALHPSELRSSARLLCVPYPISFVAETPGQDEVPPVGIGPCWCWTVDSQALPILLSKLLTSVLSFTSLSNFMTRAQHSNECCTVEEDLLILHGDCLLSRDTLIRFCNCYSENKPVKPPSITRSSIIWTTMKIVVGNNWIGIMWLFQCSRWLHSTGKWKVG